jgi:hypothetical protein
MPKVPTLHRTANRSLQQHANLLLGCLAQVAFPDVYEYSFLLPADSQTQRRSILKRLFSAYSAYGLGGIGKSQLAVALYLVKPSLALDHRQLYCNRDHYDQDDPQAYNVQTYFPRADHGSMLITGRLTSLRRLENNAGRVVEGRQKVTLAKERRCC